MSFYIIMVIIMAKNPNIPSDSFFFDTEKSSKYFPEIFDAFSHTADGKYVYICYIPEDNSIWSKEAVEYFGLPSNHMHGAGAIWTEHIFPEERDAYVREIDDLMAGRIDEHNMIYRAKNKNGIYTTVSCKGCVIRDENGQPLFFAGTMVNYDVEHAVDPVTGLLSNISLRHKMEAFANEKTPYYIVFFGIHRFANINTTYGYKFGNKILKYITDAMLAQRESGHIFRIEGTKYAYLVKQDSITEDRLFNKYNNLKNHLKSDLIIDNIPVQLELYGSYMKVDSFDKDTDAIYNSAIFSLSKAKMENMQDLLLVDDSFFSGNTETVSILGNVRRSISNDFKGFYLVYQPVVDAHTETITGAEALLRWKDEDGTTVPPGLFIDWIEQDPLFYKLGGWILKTALLECTPIIKEHPDFMLNINLSYTQLQRADFKPLLIDILKETSFPGQNLRLELTERCKILDTDLLKDHIAFFKSIGISTALDDFGTGYSALRFMAELGADQIKIDKLFIDSIHNNPAWQTLLRAITNCAYELNKSICLEGIETKEMATLLRENYKVTRFQGYYYSKPILINELIDYVKTHSK